jgi:hypothetical protein
MLVLLVGVGVLVGALLEASKEITTIGGEAMAKSAMMPLVTSAPVAYAFLRDLPNLSLDHIDTLEVTLLIE